MSPAYVPGYAQDIFVSYAHLDNEEIPPEERWVTSFLKRLHSRVRQVLGRPVSLWDDFQLLGHVEISPAVVAAVQDSATLVVVMSPSYLNSEWCERERSAFLQVIADRARSGSRVFVAHKLKTERTDRPEVLREIQGYEFWREDSHRGIPPQELTPQNDREAYYKALDRLAWELAKELMRLAGPDSTRRPPSAPSAPGGSTPGADLRAASASTPVMPHEGGRARPLAVLLAEPTDDLEEEHAQVRLYLDQAHVPALMESAYPAEESAFRAAFEQDLHASALFVQLLSSVVGKRPAGAGKSRARLQWEWAHSARKPVLQWRLPGSETRVRDADQRELLELASVRSGSLDDFKRQIWEQWNAVSRRLAASRTGPKALLLVDADRGDEELANRVSRLVKECDIDIDLAEPWRSGVPGSVSPSLIDDMKTCDAMIVIYGSVDPAWVEKQLRLWRKYEWERERPPELFAIYEGSNQPRPSVGVGVTLSGVVNLRDPDDEQQLRDRLSELARKRQETLASAPRTAHR